MSSFKDIFISYGRADSQDFAIDLTAKLTVAGLDVWFDHADIPGAVDYQRQIDDGIEKAHNFVFIISPHAVNSEYCAKELALALNYQKRIIPLMHVMEISREDWAKRYPGGSEADWQAFQAAGLHSSLTNLHPHLQRLNWIPFTAESLFAEGVAQLLEICDRQRDYVERHTLLLQQALHWQRHQKLSQDLLIGEERQQAANWLQHSWPDGQPPCLPSALHCEFINESLKNADNLMTQVFIAYADSDRSMQQTLSYHLVRQGITVQARSLNRESAVWADLQTDIDRADNVLVLLSPDALQATDLRRVLDHAVGYHKRIVPLIVKSLQRSLQRSAMDSIFDRILEEDTAPALPPPLSNLALIDLVDIQQETGLQTGLDALLKTLKTNADYHRQQKIWLVKALKWEAQGHNPSILLRGQELRQAEAWLKGAGQWQAHPPTALHAEFITASVQQPPLTSLDIFISYSRKDSEFARRLNDALQVQGKTTWFDQDSIASATDFQAEIRQGISGADNLVLILSPDSVASPYCRMELDYALELHKRVIPVLWRRILPEEQHPAIRTIQWIDFQGQGRDFWLNLGELIRTLDTDRDHVRSHTKWHQRATEWQQNGEAADMLLRGSEFVVAETWLQEALQTGKMPRPTELQQRFIAHSQRAIEAEREREKRQTVMLRSLLTVVGAAYANAEAQRQRAELVQAGQILALCRYSQALQMSHQGLESLVEAIRAGRQLQQQMDRITPDSDLITQVTNTLRTALHELRERNQLGGHRQPITQVAFSPDGECLATASLDGLVHLWTPQGQRLTTLSDHREAVLGLAFSPDGQQLATASADQTVKLWTTTGDLQQTFNGHRDWVYSVSFSPDGQWLASSSVDETVKLWDLDGNLHQSIDHPDTVVSLSFRPDGQQLATACADQLIRLWTLEGELVAALTGHKDAVTSVTFHPTEPLLLSTSLDHTARLWPLESGHEICLTGHQDIVWQASFSPDGHTLVTTSGDRTAKLWDLTGQELLTLQGHRDLVSGVSFSPDQQIIATCSHDATVRLWQYGPPQVRSLKGHQEGVQSVALSPGLERVVTAGTDCQIGIWDGQGQRLQQFTGHEGSIKAVAIRPIWTPELPSHSHFLATASVDNTAKLWSASGELLATCTGHRLPVSQVAFSPDGQLLATASYDKTARLWTLQGEPRQILAGHMDQVWDVAFSPDGQLLATASWDKTWRLWTLEGKLLHTGCGHQDSLTALAFSPDGSHIATASQDKTVRLWTLTGDCVRVLVHDKPITTVAWHPSGDYLATSGFDHQITLWSRDGQRLQTLQGHTHTVWQVRFSADGKRLVSASEDGSARMWQLDFAILKAAADLWHLELPDLLERGCCHVGDYLQHNERLNESDRALLCLSSPEQCLSSPE